MTDTLVAATDQPQPIKGSNTVAKTIINTIKPVFGGKVGKIFTNAVAQSTFNTKFVPWRKTKISSGKLNNSHEKTKVTQGKGNIDLQYFLASGKSSNQHDWDRFAAGFLRRPRRCS